MPAATGPSNTMTTDALFIGASIKQSIDSLMEVRLPAPTGTGPKKNNVGAAWNVGRMRCSSAGVSAIRALNGCKVGLRKGGKCGRVWRWRTGPTD